MNGQERRNAKHPNTRINTMTTELTKIANDTRGNYRYVCSYLAIADTFDAALKITRDIGGSKYKSQKNSDGIVFATRKTLEELQESIERVKEGLHEQTIREHVTGNVSDAIDQADEYGGLKGAYDSYSQNTIDSVLEDGYSCDDAYDAAIWFTKLFEEKTGLTV